MEENGPSISNVTVNSDTVDATDDDERLIKPRNNFRSYSNDDVSVRFRSATSSRNTAFSSIIETSSYPPRSRLTSETIPPGATDYLSANYESLDYDTCENYLLLEEERKKGYKFVVKKNIARWFIFLLIGIVTALIAAFVDISIEELTNLKYRTLKNNIGQQNIKQELSLKIVTQPVVISGVQNSAFIQPKNIEIQTFGESTAEGPMIHSGAIVAAGISQGKSTTFKKDFKIFEYFREDHEKRDFVSGGAASGVSAAFGAPIGGVLFSIEEGTSFFKQSLTWRTFFASMITTFTLNIILSAYHGHAGDLSYPGLLNLGKFEAMPYQIYEIPLFMLIGTLGGVLGALWNHVNYKISCFRMKFVKKKWVKVLEALFVALLSATIGFLMIYFVNDCNSKDEFSPKFPIQMYCKEGEYNAVAAIWLQTPESSVRSLFHDPKGSHKDETLVIFVILYFFLAAVTFGLSMSSGLFIPSLLIGAAWGRLAGSGLSRLWPNCNLLDPRKYALLGAAAQLGGVVRMTISLTVILIEATGGISFGLPLIIVLLMAKWVGDFFNEGIYDIHIQMNGVPILPWEPPPLSNNIYASEIMSHPVITLKTVENVGHIVELLKCVSFNGFPVVDPPTSDQEEINCYGRFRGLILRCQLIVLLQNKIFNEYCEYWDESLNIRMFRNEYPRYPTIEHIVITPEEKTYQMDLRPFMNPSPYTLQHSATLPRVFGLFRALGLRHLPIVNDTNEMTPDQVKWKFNRLLAKYKNCVDNNEKSGRAPMTFDFYDEFEEIFQKGKKDKNIDKSLIISSTISSNRNKININEQIEKCNNEEKIRNDSERTRTGKGKNNKDEIKKRPISEVKNNYDIEKGDTHKPILGQHTERSKLLIKENKKNTLNVSKQKNSKRALENEYLSHLKTVQEQQKLRDERMEKWMKTKENALQLKKRQLHMREEDIEMKRNVAAKKLKFNEKRHEDLMRVETQKCGLLRELLKSSVNAEDSASD